MADPGIVEPAAVLRRLGGSAHRAELLRHVTWHALRAATLTGTVRRVSRGTYALPDTPPAGEAAKRLRGVLSHESAAAHWLLETLHPAATVHITVPRSAQRLPQRGITLHYRDVAHAEDLGDVTAPLRTVLDCAGDLPFAEALAIADSALRRDLVSADVLREAADLRRGPGARRCRQVAAHADGRAANPFESALRASLIERGIRTFRPQVPIATAAGTFHVDLADPGCRLVAEADSFAFHGSPSALDRDCRRYDELVREGWQVLRFTWSQVVFEPEWVTGIVIDTRNSALGRRSHRNNERSAPSERRMVD